MAKKKKSKVKKILGAALLAGLGAAALRNKNTGGGDPNMIRGVVPMNTGDTGMPGFTFEDMMIQEGGTGISPFMAAKGGRVSKGCGKVMAGRNKKTKYI
jgi:hypothetical protein